MAAFALPDSIIRESRRLECEQDGMYFLRYFFKQRLGARMKVGAHHAVIQSALDKVMTGEVSRLIINLPPGYTKTEQALIHFTARGLALHPRSRFMHLTYSDTLARLSSSYTQSVVTSQEYQAMWPTRVRPDTSAKNLWRTDQEGGVYAVTPKGQVTGFRAGYMQEDGQPWQFTGALQIDDPIKPADALSDQVRKSINDNYGDTIASRLADEEVPIILIMQRVHWDDLSGFLLRGGSGEDWHHLNLSVLIDPSDKYPREYSHGIPLDHDLPPGWLWPAKHNEKHRKALQASKRKWQAQYKQAPARYNAEGALWTEETIAAARDMKKPWQKLRTVIGVDPAVTSNEDSDETGIVAASKWENDKYSVDEDGTCKKSVLGWARAVLDMAHRHQADAIVVESNQGGDLCAQNIRTAMKEEGAPVWNGRIIQKHVSNGKYSRAEPIAALYELGQVWHRNATTGDPETDDVDLAEMEDEVLTYVPFETKQSPNRLDAMVHALLELSDGGASVAVW